MPEFHALVGNEAAEELQHAVGDGARTSQALKKCFTRMMSCEKKVFVDELNELVKRVTEEGEEPERQNGQNWKNQNVKFGPTSKRLNL